MRISTTEEYALRALACLVTASKPLKSKDLSKLSGVPQAYLSKVLRQLVSARILRAQRGHGGGFVLARASRKISFASVFSALESRTRKPVCVFGWKTCGAKNPCPLHQSWKAFREDSDSWASTNTLADIARQSGRYRRVMNQTEQKKDD